MKNRTVAFVFIMLFAIPFVNAQLNEESILQSDTLSIKKKLQIVGIPVIFYTPETEFGLGGGAQLFLLRKTNIYNSRLSNILITAIYTTKKQLMIDAKPQIYFSFGNLMLDGMVKYKVFPNSFWGIGNNTPESDLESYNMRSIELKAALLLRFPPTWNFGFEYHFEDHDMIEVKENGLLSSGLIKGSEGARISGINTVFNFDDRDNVFGAFKGNFMQIKAGFYSKVLGGDYSYNKYIIDLRKYFPLSKNSVIAAQIYLENSFSDVPFQTKAWLGGSEKTRGYFRGRYIDNHMFAVQAEYRIRFHPRWVAAGFISNGEVANQPNDFFKEAKFSYGGGLRFKILKSNPSHVRLDIGVTQYGDVGIYFGVNEAF